MLAVLGVTLMVAFVLAPPLLDYMAMGRGPQDPVVVETKYGDYKESDLFKLRSSRELVEMFLARAAVETINEQIKSGQIDPRMGDNFARSWAEHWQRQLLVRSKPGADAAALETLILSKKAEEMGMVVSDRAINDVLAQITSDSLTSADLQNICDTMSERKVSMTRMFEALRTEMMASKLSQLFQQSLADVPPAQKFEYFLRLNQRAKAEVVPLAVSDFTSQVANPSDKTLAELFEKYKDRLPDAASPEPGFKEPTRAAFQYFKADFARFKEEMKPKVTDKEIEDYYAQNKAQFQVLDLPKDDTPKDGSPDASKESPGDSPAEEPKASDAPKDGAAQEDAPKADAKPAEPAAAPSQPKDAPQEPSAEAPKEPDAPAASPPKEAPKPDAPAEPKQSTKASRTPIRLVSAQTGDEPASAAAGDASQKPAGPALPAPSDTAPAETKPAEAQPAEAPKNEAPAPETPAANAPTGETPAAETPAAETPAAPVGDAAEEKPKEPEYEPLEKVKEQIRESVAGQKAAARIAEIMDELTGEMRRYSQERADYEAAGEAKTPAQSPKPFPFAELAATPGVQAK
jgi:hypothetical protein